MAEQWTRGDAYERFMGRWSSLVAPRFLDWLDVAPGLRWADVGCGSGALTDAVLEHASPRSVLAVDPAPAQVAAASRRIRDPRVSFGVATAERLPVASCDLVASGLVLNFVPDPDAAVGAMARAVVAGGRVAGYVWDYAEGMGMLRTFWDVASSLDPAAAELDEGPRFPHASPAALVRLWKEAGLRAVRSTGLTVPMVFADFDDYWTPFLGGQGPAAGYAASLEDARRDALREGLRAALPAEPDGRIALSARAWAVCGTVG